MYRLPDKEPTEFEVSIFKRIFLPILAVGVIVTFFNISSQARRCELICTSKGFINYRYTPAVRYGDQGEACYCITKKENNIKNKISKGVRVF